MRKNRAANFFAPAVLAQPRDADERMSFGCAVSHVWMALVIHVVQQANRLPKIDIVSRPAKRGEMLHRISDRIAMFPQTFGLDPFVQDLQCARSERFTHHMICGLGRCFNIEQRNARHLYWNRFRITQSPDFWAKTWRR